MDKLLKELCENLEEQLATYKLLVKYEQEKQEVLVNGEINQLEELVKKEQKVVFKNGELEKTRQEHISQLAEQAGVPQDDLTISRVIELAEGDMKDRLSNVYEELEYVLVELKDLNLKNNSLIEQSLSYINYSLDILVGASKDDPGTYDKSQSGKEESGKAKKSKRSFLDRKI